MRSLTMALLLVGTTAPAARAQEAIPPDVLQKVKQASVFVKVSLGPLEFSGSGFVVHTDGPTVHLVTNAHVVAKPGPEALATGPFGTGPRRQIELQKIQSAIQNLEPDVSVVFNSGTRNEQIVKAQTVALDGPRDLAILKVDGVRSPPPPLALDVNFKPVETTPVYIFGFPFGEALSKSNGNPAITVGRGAVSSLRLDERGEDSVVQIDGALNPGNSGGPVVDVTGRLVGVAVATIRGSGIGFAIPPATLQKMLDGRVSEVRVASRAESNGTSLEITAILLDPFRRIRQVAVHCVPDEVKMPAADPQKPLEKSEQIVLVVNGSKAVGTWRIPGSAGKPAVVTIQPMCIDTAGKPHYDAPMVHRLSSPGTPQPPSLTPPRRLATQTPKVHRGATSQLGANSLVGGVLVVGSNATALGLGLVQTGEATMRFTYFAILRLPAGSVSRTSYLSKSKTVGDQTRALYSAFLDDATLTIEHAYAADKAILEGEELTILGQSFDPANGRLFLIDCNGPTPVVTQKKAEWSAAMALVPIDDEHLIDLAHRALEDLVKADDEVAKFASGGIRKSAGRSPP